MRFCPVQTVGWAVSAAWKHLSSRVLVGLLSDAGRSRLWTSTFEWLRPLPERSQHGKALALHVVGEFDSVQHDSGWMFLASLPTAASLKDKSMDVASASLPQSGMSTLFITIHLASPVQPNFGADRSAIGYEGRGVDCKVSSCAQAIFFCTSQTECLS